MKVEHCQNDEDTRQMHRLKVELLCETYCIQLVLKVIHSHRISFICKCAIHQWSSAIIIFPYSKARKPMALGGNATIVDLQVGNDANCKRRSSEDEKFLVSSTKLKHCSDM